MKVTTGWFLLLQALHVWRCIKCLPIDQSGLVMPTKELMFGKEKALPNTVNPGGMKAWLDQKVNKMYTKDLSVSGPNPASSTIQINLLMSPFPTGIEETTLPGKKSSKRLKKTKGLPTSRTIVGNMMVTINNKPSALDNTIAQVHPNIQMQGQEHKTDGDVLQESLMQSANPSTKQVPNSPITPKIYESSNVDNQLHQEGRYMVAFRINIERGGLAAVIVFLFLLLLGILFILYYIREIKENLGKLVSGHMCGTHSAEAGKTGTSEDQKSIAKVASKKRSSPGNATPIVRTSILPPEVITSCPFCVDMSSSEHPISNSKENDASEERSSFDSHQNFSRSKTTALETNEREGN